jgi:hypothetical protein
MPLKPDGTVNLNVYAHTRTLQFNTFEEAVKYAKGLVAHYGGTVKSDTRGKSVNFRSGEKDMMAREVVARKGSKRVELSGPNGNGQWVVTVMQEEKQVVPGEANDRFVESKFYSTEAGARRAASKILASRLGEKAKFKVEDRFYFGKGRKERFGASDKVDGLIATAYRALRNGDKAAARRLIASAEALVQSDSSVPNYIVNELKDLKKSLSF